MAKEALDICWQGGPTGGYATGTPTFPPSQDPHETYNYAYKALEGIAQQALQVVAVAVGLEAQDLMPLLTTSAELDQGALLLGSNLAFFL
jgi:hypothetical protein